jgi:3-hydroxybutyryl-CoA dehydrogenase
VPEQEALKAAVLRDAAAPAHTILASNASSILITRLAASTRRLEAFVGLHFMVRKQRASLERTIPKHTTDTDLSPLQNPVPLALMKIIPGLETGAHALATARALAVRLGKTAVESADRPGFVVNRLLVPQINEAFRALEEGVAKAETIDAGMRLGVAHAMGPLALADLIGLDTCLAIARVLRAVLGDTYRPAPLLARYVAAGRLGRKAGRGFFFYPREYGGGGSGGGGGGGGAA